MSTHAPPAAPAPRTAHGSVDGRHPGLHPPDSEQTTQPPQRRRRPRPMTAWRMDHRCWFPRRRCRSRRAGSRATTPPSWPRRCPLPPPADNPPPGAADVRDACHAVQRTGTRAAAEPRAGRSPDGAPTRSSVAPGPPPPRASSVGSLVRTLIGRPRHPGVPRRADDGGHGARRTAANAEGVAGHLSAADGRASGAREIERVVGRYGSLICRR